MRRGLTSDGVARAALAVLDEAGWDGLTMRGLGRHLGVDPMAVYRHVPSKEDLLDLVAERVLAEALEAVGPAADDESWQVRVLRIAEAVQAAVDQHPAAAARLATAPPLGPAAMALLAALLAALERSGAPAADVVHAAQAAVAVTFAATAPGRRDAEAAAGDRVRAVRAGMVSSRDPRLVAAAPHVRSVVPAVAAVALLVDGLSSRSTPEER